MLPLEIALGFIRFMLGAAVFSFMNVVAWRLPRGRRPVSTRAWWDASASTSRCPAARAW